jgi:hypothetical protein
MDKRYQIFVSSTFRDLEKERRAVMQCLLEMNCIPAGMELFPAADDTAWAVITRAIDQSDYYILIVGGRYGSTNAAGTSYTELEYDYALRARKCILPFYPQNPGMIPQDMAEQDPVARERLVQFCAKVGMAHHWKYWTTPEDLASKIITALHLAFTTSPAVGWVRAEYVKTIEDVTRIADLHARVAELETERTALQAKCDELMKSDFARTLAISKMVAAFPGMVRRLKIEFDLERGDHPGPVNSASHLLYQAHRQLLEYVQEVDEEKHPSVYMEFERVLREIQDLMRQHPVDPKDVNSWWNSAANTIGSLKFLCRKVEEEPW